MNREMELFASALTTQIWDTVAMTIESFDFVSQWMQTASSKLAAEYGQLGMELLADESV